MSSFKLQGITWIALVCFLASNAHGLTQLRYSIALDSDGNKQDITYNHPVIANTVVTSLGEGYNGTWYYYPQLDRYIMWFYNGPYSANEQGYANLWSFVGGIDGSARSVYQISLGWTTDQWTNNSTPPLPSDISSQSVFDQYTDTKYVTSSPGSQMYNGSDETTKTAEIEDFRPAWFCVSVQGKNVVIYRYIYLDSEGTSPDPGTQGACCNTSTGSCYISTTGTCSQGYTYLGDNTTCNSCTSEPQTYNLDFGDAPSTYKIKLLNNGARHYIATGVMLGQLITGESDGQPSTLANQDSGDDGVNFPSPFTIGQNVNITVTATALGSINAWLDLNRDGDWDDAEEQILSDEPVTAGTNTLSFMIPDTASSGQSYLHVRYNTAGGLGIYGLAADGEVEDYAVTLEENDSPPVTALTPVPPSHAITTHWSQPAQRINEAQSVLSGWSTISNYNNGPIVTDDWTLDQAQTLRGFRWWGTFDQWVLTSLPTQKPDAFHISIWSHNNTIGTPDTLVWETICDTWTWALAGELDDSTTAFEFTAFLSQDQWFIPEINALTTYWIGISAVYDENTPQTWSWQWLTTTKSHGSPAINIYSTTYNNSAAWPPTVDSVYLSGDYVTYPANTGWDMAFELMTTKTVTTQSELQGDVNGDGVINSDDLFLLLSIINQL